MRREPQWGLFTGGMIEYVSTFDTRAGDERCVVGLRRGRIRGFGAAADAVERRTRPQSHAGLIECCNRDHDSGGIEQKGCFAAEATVRLDQYAVGVDRNQRRNADRSESLPAF